MTDIDERIERLIVRQLDGEITPVEESELRRELLRTPQARALRDEYREIDRLAAGVLHGARRRGVSLRVAGAVAASLLLALLLFWGTASEQPGAPRTVQAAAAATQGDDAPSVARRAARNVLVIPGEEGSTYLLTVDHVREMRVAPATGPGSALPAPI